MRGKIQKFILIICYSRQFKIFDLKERTCQNHVSICTTWGYNKSMCAIDCFNNLICQNSDGLMSILDIDNALCQTVKPAQCVLQTRFRINKKTYARQFQNTCLEPDKIFDHYTFDKEQKIHENPSELRQSSKTVSRDKELVKDIGCYSFFGFHVSNMFHKSKRVITQPYKFEFPELMLNLLCFSQESEIISILEKVSFQELIEPNHAFANLSILSLYTLR